MAPGHGRVDYLLYVDKREVGVVEGKPEGTSLSGVDYAGGVKANVLFFDKKPARPGQPWTDALWVYDLRTNQHFTQAEPAAARPPRRLRRLLSAWAGSLDAGGVRALAEFTAVAEALEKAAADRGPQGL